MTLRQKHFIDSHKCCNAAAILGLMAMYDAWDNTAAWLYLALHGTYGVLWTLKSLNFGDKQWEKSTPLWYGLGIWVTLSGYWVAPWIIVSRDVQPPPWYLGLAVAIFAFGLFFHFASDMQKHAHIQANTGTLLCSGLWARCRNPNYFGELLIYCGFCMIAMHWAPFVVLGAIIGGMWVPNMIRKDRSLSRYPEFAAWKKRSGLIVPFLF